MQRMEHVTLRKEGEIHRKVKIRLPFSEGYLSAREIAQGVLRLSVSVLQRSPLSVAQALHSRRNALASAIEPYA